MVIWIYGDNALANVINVVSKKDAVNKVSFSAGDGSYTNINSHYSNNMGNNKRIFLAFQKQTGGEFNSFFRGFTALNTGNVSLGYESDSIIGGVK